MKTKIFKNGAQMMAMLLAFLILLSMQKLVAQICANPANTVYGLTGTGEIREITVSSGAVGPKLNPANTGNLPDLSNAMGYNQLNGKFYYFKRNVRNAPQEFACYEPAMNRVVLLANSPVMSVINLGCVTPDGLGYYCIDALGGLYYYRLPTNTWTTICTNIKDQFGTSLSFIISGGGIPTPASRIYGDMAFDGYGNLWVMISGPSDYGLYKFNAAVPNTSQAAMTMTQVVPPTTPAPGGASIGGIAFNNTGQMLFSTNSPDNKLYRMGNTYAVTFVSNLALDAIGTDLTSCNYPMFLLSVNWLAFTAEQKNTQTVLNWTVAEKTGNYGFAIEHSADGKNWEQLDFLTTKGKENSIQQYNYTHNDVLKGKHYYRIASVDREDRKAHSETRLVGMSEGATLSVWPNPAQDVIKLEATTGKNYNNARVSIYDQSGREVKGLMLQRGITEVNIKSLHPGSYFVRVQFADGETINHRFIKNIQ